MSSEPMSSEPMSSEPMSSEPWYTAKLVFRHLHPGSSCTRAFEERVVLIRADSEDVAMRRAEQHAAAYANDHADLEDTRFIQLFHVFDDSIDDGVEVFSLNRESALSTDDYLDAFYDTGDEFTRQQVED